MPLFIRRRRALCVHLFFESLDDDMIIAISSTAFVVEIIESTSFILLNYTNLLLTYIMGQNQIQLTGTFGHLFCMRRQCNADCSLAFHTADAYRRSIGSSVNTMHVVSPPLHINLTNFIC